MCFYSASHMAGVIHAYIVLQWDVSAPNASEIIRVLREYRAFTLILHP